jgi:hypothetical protein
MAGKKKGKKDDKPKEPPKIIIPDYTPKNLEPLPISVKIHHLNDIYIIYTDEYSKSLDIKEKLSKLIGLEVENIKLYLGNRRLIEDGTTNHDQQINNCTDIYAIYKNVKIENDEGNTQVLFEKINDILKYAGVTVKPNNNPDKIVVKQEVATEEKK